VAGLRDNAHTETAVYCDIFKRQVSRVLAKEACAESGRDIENFKVEVAGEITVIHSTLEGFFDKINPTVDWDKALQPVFVKCYSSDAPLKSKYAELETKLFNTEKIWKI
jgi:hypothetical protein